MMDCLCFPEQGLPGKDGPQGRPGPPGTMVSFSGQPGVQAQGA